MSSLVRANLLLVALQVGHTLDHAVNQPDRHYSAALLIPGPLGIGVAALAAFLAARSRPEAPAVSMLAGAGTVLGFIAIHVLPHWSAFSDPYSEMPTNVGNWIFVAVPMAAGAVTFLLGLRELRKGGVAPPQPAR